MTNFTPVWLVLLWTSFVQCAVELPKFSQLKLLYPGYYLHGGQYRDRQVVELVGGNHTNVLLSVHNTSPLRLSWTLNRYGGRHSIGQEPVTEQNSGIASITGKDRNEYIYRNVAYGPFLALKYGEPISVRPEKHDMSEVMRTFQGKQGIIQFISYHRHLAGGHIGLWDCDHFHQSRKWSSGTHILSVQFWETPDSFCPPKMEESPGEPRFVPLDPHKVVVSRHNYFPKYFHDDSLPHIRHQKKHKRQDSIWIQ